MIGQTITARLCSLASPSCGYVDYLLLMWHATSLVPLLSLYNISFSVRATLHGVSGKFLAVRGSRTD